MIKMPLVLNDAAVGWRRLCVGGQLLGKLTPYSSSS